MIRTYTLSDGTKVVFEYDHNGIGKITLEAMDILMSLLKATVDEDEPQSDDKHAVCTGCDYYDLPNAFHPCASCVDFSKYKPKIEDEPQSQTEISIDKEKTLWIKMDTLEGYDRVITERGDLCRIFYEDCGECAHNTDRKIELPEYEPFSDALDSMDCQSR